MPQLNTNDARVDRLNHALAYAEDNTPQYVKSAMRLAGPAWKSGNTVGSYLRDPARTAQERNAAAASLQDLQGAREQRQVDMAKQGAPAAAQQANEKHVGALKHAQAGNWSRITELAKKELARSEQTGEVTMRTRLAAGLVKVDQQISENRQQPDSKERRDQMVKLCDRQKELAQPFVQGLTAERGQQKQEAARAAEAPQGRFREPDGYPRGMDSHPSNSSIAARHQAKLEREERQAQATQMNTGVYMAGARGNQFSQQGMALATPQMNAQVNDAFRKIDEARRANHQARATAKAEQKPQQAEQQPVQQAPDNRPMATFAVQVDQKGLDRMKADGYQPSVVKTDRQGTYSAEFKVAMKEGMQDKDMKAVAGHMAYSLNGRYGMSAAEYTSKPKTEQAGKQIEGTGQPCPKAGEMANKIADMRTQVQSTAQTRGSLAQTQFQGQTQGQGQQHKPPTLKV